MSKSTEMVSVLKTAYEKRISVIKDNMALIDEIATELAEIKFTTFEVCAGDKPTLDLCFTGKKKDLELVWRTLRQHEYEPNVRPAAKEPSFATHWHSNKHSLVVWMHFASEECKPVYVGMRMVERPHYEVQCDSDLGEIGT